MIYSVSSHLKTNKRKQKSKRLAELVIFKLIINPFSPENIEKHDF